MVGYTVKSKLLWEIYSNLQYTHLLARKIVIENNQYT